MTEENKGIERPSKSQLKRESHALQELGTRLVNLSQTQLASMDLPENLYSAVIEAQQIHERGGRKRQLQYIGKLMRNVDPSPIQAALAELDLGQARASAQHHAIENWRDRLIEEGNTALEQLLNEHPEADRQYLRQLVRNAVAEKRAEKAPRSARALFRYIRDLLESKS